MYLYLKILISLQQKYIVMNNFNLKTDITWHDFLIRLGLIIVTVGIIVWFLPSDTDSSFKIEKGKPWAYADLRAPFDFPILKTDETVKQERDSLLRQYEPYFNLNKETEAAQIRQFAKDYNQGIPGISSDYISIIANRLHAIYHQGVMSTTDYASVNKDSTRMVRVERSQSQRSHQQHSPGQRHCPARTDHYRQRRHRGQQDLQHPHVLSERAGTPQ